MRPTISRARQMRSAMSEPEVILWSRLKRLRERGFHIRRQAPFRGYYLDFVCFQRRIVIEVDGSQHGEDGQAEHDAVRDRILRRHGFQVLRFWAGDLRRNLHWVMDQIVLALEAAPSTREERSSPRAELEPDFPTLTASRSVPPH
jgi:very-short-patch-repair endonuclease